MNARRNNTDIILKAAAYFSDSEDIYEMGRDLVEAGADDLADGGFWILDLSSNGNEFYSPNYIKSVGYDDGSFPSPPNAWKSVVTDSYLIKLEDAFAKHIESKDTEQFHTIAKYNKKDGGILTVICTGLLVIKNGIAEYMVGSHVIIK